MAQKHEFLVVVTARKRDTHTHTHTHKHMHAHTHIHTCMHTVLSGTVWVLRNNYFFLTMKIKVLCRWA